MKIQAISTFFEVEFAEDCQKWFRILSFFRTLTCQCHWIRIDHLSSCSAQLLESLVCGGQHSDGASLCLVDRWFGFGQINIC